MMNRPNKSKINIRFPAKKDIPYPDEAHQFHNRSAVGYGVKWLRILFLGAVLLVSFYLVLMPFLPLVPYYFRQLTGKNEYIPQDPREHSESGTTSERLTGDRDEIPDVNTLVIPAVGVKVPISEGADDSALNRGAWHRPGTGTPIVGGNMVLTGHRFKYLPPSNLTFYHLDKLVIGDGVIVYWDGNRYDYLVKKIYTVTPDRIEVEAPTSEHQLTLYTCTPLWTAKERLVIIAEPVVQ